MPVSFSLPSGANLSGNLQLWMQIHGLKYQTEASVQVNGGAWIPINDSTVTLLGNAAAYGGIGGGFATLKLTINLPAGAINPGSNTLTFRFNGTDGITSGFRVLDFNILSGGTQLISSGNFTLDDPSSWTAAPEQRLRYPGWRDAVANGPPDFSVRGADTSDLQSVAIRRTGAI